MLLTVRCRGTRSNQALSCYFAAHSMNAPLGISSVFHQCNLGISTRAMMFEMPSSEFYVVLVDGDMQLKISHISKKEIWQPYCRILYGHYLPTVIVTIIWYSITHSLFHSRLKTSLFCKSFPPQPFLFLFQDSLHGFPRLFTVISYHTYFLLFSFSVFALFSCRFRAVD